MSTGTIVALASLGMAIVLASLVGLLLHELHHFPEGDQ